MIVEFALLQNITSILLATFMAMSILGLGVMIVIFSKYYLFNRR